MKETSHSMGISGHLWNVVKVDVAKLNPALSDLERSSVGQVPNLSVHVEQVEHVLHVYESSLDHAVVSAKVEWRVELDDVRAVEDRVTRTHMHTRLHTHMHVNTHAHTKNGQIRKLP